MLGIAIDAQTLRIWVLVELRCKLLVWAMIIRIAVVCRSVRIRFCVAMQRSSQYPRIIPLWGAMVVEMYRIMGSMARHIRSWKGGSLV